MLDTEPAHCTLRARDSLTANSSDRLASSLLSLGMTRFRATTAAVMSFFITDGRKGQTFFRSVKERGDRTSQDRKSAKREFLQTEIQECFERPAYLYKNQHAMGFQRSKR
ncbi:hypothetical protein ACFX10_019416 [Malus domestica]